VRRYHPLSITDVHHQTPNAVTLRFEIPATLAESFRFRAGQHLNIRHLIDGEEVRRSYSICSGEQEETLTITVKRIEQGLFSNFANNRIEPGATLEVMPPTGHFCLPDSAKGARRFVAFAAGSGITPIIAMIKTALARDSHCEFILFYGNRDTRSIIYREAVEDIKNAYMTRFSRHHILSRETGDIALYNGRIDGGKATELFKKFCAQPADDVFVCGPNTMIDDTIAALTGLGFPREHIHFERFATNTVARTAVRHAQARAQSTHAAETTTVAVIVDGKQREFTMPRDGLVLEAAQRAGIELPYSCKGGVCSTCRAHVREGKAEMDVNYALEQWELDAGFILSCQARPGSKRLVLDYDNQ
jgi:ring-1,2-phenylacetyl-CoA epoxidase subunit PaaE